jgi:cobalt/nickel transport system permease protein
MGLRICLLTIVLIGLASPAMAMHVADGILPIGWSAAWWAVAAPFAIWGLLSLRAVRRSDPRASTLIALVGSAVFVISCMPIPVPFAGTCSHPCGTGLAAVLIGPGPTVIVAGIVLAFQSLFLGHGGLTTLGANLVSMGIVGALAATLFFRGAVRLRLPIAAAAFLAGAVSDWATYATTSFQLASALADEGSFGAMFGMIAAAFLPTQLPLGVFEGLLTVFAYRFIRAHRPELLVTGRPLSPIVGGRV